MGDSDVYTVHHMVWVRLSPPPAPIFTFLVPHLRKYEVVQVVVSDCDGQWCDHVFSVWRMVVQLMRRDSGLVT